ncbi:hypothetical protein P885DRAFT_37782 [Corynascus similis CBS 632.67]
MGHTFVLADGSLPREEMPFHSQTYTGLDDGFEDSNMTYNDPMIHNTPSNCYSSTWARPVGQSFKNNAAPFFVVDPARQVPSHASTRPAVSVSPAPTSYARYGSPLSSTELSPSGNILSPAADTESYYDSYPRTPSDVNLHSPFQAPLPLEPYAHAVQFSSMGPDYVNPYDLNPSQQQQSEYCESDNDIIDFNFPPQQSYCNTRLGRDAEPAHRTPVLELLAQQQPGGDQMESLVKEEIRPESEYPPLEDDTGLEEQPLPKRQHEDDNDDAASDGNYQPNKRQRTTPRTPTRRGAKVATLATSTARRTRNKAGNPISPSRSTPSISSSKARLGCPECKQRAFTTQADLDAHIKKEHRRPFSCVFDFAGCSRTFGSKNEWKRHVSTQHLLLNYWVCTEGACAKASQDPSPHRYLTADSNDNPHGAIFNRKDLFTQHLKRMHAPKEIKDLLPPAASKRGPSKGSNTTATTGTKLSNPHTTALVAQWTARVKHLQDTAIRPRCHLPTLMRCPVAGCVAAPFRGADAWNRRMEHVAKHMDGTGGSGQANTKNNTNVAIEEADPTLVEWAASPEVAIIVADERGGWVLKSPLERGPGGNVVVTAPVVRQGRGEEKAAERIEGEIVVGEMEDEEEEDADENDYEDGDVNELDAEGEEDDDGLM